MNQQHAVAPGRSAPERQLRILDAAERVFARAGFAGATMNDVATEAGMSPGNLYRYFASKDALIAGLVERDRQEIAADFSGLDPTRGVLDQLEGIARKHLVEAPREKSTIALQIWAESARNPGMASLCRAIEGDIQARIGELIEAGMRSGELAADLDGPRFLQAMFMMADGLMCRRAQDPAFDAAAAAITLFTAMRALAATLRRPEDTPA